MNVPAELDLTAFDAREILQLLPDGAYICDRDRRIVFWNSAAERITGWTAAEVVGRHCRDNILVHVDKDGHPLCGKEFCPLHRCMVTGSKSSMPLLVFALHHDGYRFPVEVTVAPMMDAKGRVVGGIEIFRDMTETFHDLEHASRIQRELLKVDLPSDARLEFQLLSSPASQVGGDFHRVEPLADGHRYAIMVADVTGHGVSAALHCMQLCALWVEGRPLLDRPAEFITTMSRRLAVLTGQQDCFATALYVLLDARNGGMRWVNAGHPDGFVLGLSPPGRLESTGPALGLIPEFQFVEEHGLIPVGGSLLLYSDGAVEIPDKEGNEIGPEGLLRLAEEVAGRQGRGGPRAIGGTVAQIRGHHPPAG
jgi:sigma-B regulation protein RsbU (phosphoserine phosphatase)